MVTKPEGAEVLNISWETVETLCKSLAQEVLQGPLKCCKYILPVPRGGLIPATILSHLINLPILESISFAPHNEPILVVDDMCDTGETFKKVRQTTPLWFFVVPVAKTTGTSYCDLYTMRVPQTTWVKFPWEYDE